MTSVRYRGFDIVPRPYQLADTGQWTVDVTIHRGERFRSFALDEHHPTLEDATRQCIGLGQRIIDGRVKGWSVEVLRHQVGMMEALRHLLTTESIAIVLMGVAAVLSYGGYAMMRAVR